MITFSNIKFSTQPLKTGRQLVLVDISIDSSLYNWMVYTPVMCGDDLLTYLTENASTYYNDIMRKEMIWSTYPKTRQNEDVLTGEITDVSVNKEEVVHPTIPDFLEKMTEDSLVSSQLAAIWDEDKYEAMRLLFYDIKDRFTDYDNISLEAAIAKKKIKVYRVGSDLLKTYYDKLTKSLLIETSNLGTLREIKRLALKNKADIMCGEIDALTTINDVIDYEINFN